MNEYRKLPLIKAQSLNNLVRAFRWALKRRDLNTRGLKTGMKNRLETSYSCVDLNKFFILLFGFT